MYPNGFQHRYGPEIDECLLFTSFLNGSLYCTFPVLIPPLEVECGGADNLSSLSTGIQMEKLRRTVLKELQLRSHALGPDLGDRILNHEREPDAIME